MNVAISATERRTSISLPQFRPTFSRTSLVLLVALLLGETTINYIDRQVSNWAVGAVLDATHSYVPVFIGLCLLMPIGLVLGFYLMRRVEPIRDFDLMESAI